MESGKWKVENGKLKMESGKWKMENGKWKVENGKDVLTYVDIGEVLKFCRGIFSTY